MFSQEGSCQAAYTNGGRADLESILCFRQIFCSYLAKAKQCIVKYYLVGRPAVGQIFVGQPKVSQIFGQPVGQIFGQPVQVHLSVKYLVGPPAVSPNEVDMFAVLLQFTEGGADR